MFSSRSFNALGLILRSLIHTKLLFVYGIRWVQLHFWNNNGYLPCIVIHFPLLKQNTWDNQFIKMKDVVLLSSVYKVIATLLSGLWQDSTSGQAICRGAQFPPLWMSYERKTRVWQSPVRVWLLWLENLLPSPVPPPQDSSKMATKPLAHRSLMDSPDPHWLVEVFVFCRIPLFTLLWSISSQSRDPQNWRKVLFCVSKLSAISFM